MKQVNFQSSTIHGSYLLLVGVLMIYHKLS